MGDNQKPVGKPFPGYDFDTFDGCVAAMSDEPGIDDPEEFCNWLEEEGKEALSDPQAQEVLTGLEVEFVSPVDTPAQDSEWVIAKDADDPSGSSHRWQSEATLYVQKDRDDSGDDVKQIAFAPVLIPKEADKQGDVIPKPAIEDAAHRYLSEYRKVDSDHDLRDGKGTPVESWTLKQDTTFEMPDGTESREYPEGTWVLGIRFNDETWDRVVSGDLNGLSIYGGAKPVDVDSLLGKSHGQMSKSETDDADESVSKGVGEFVEDKIRELAESEDEAADMVGEIAEVAGRDESDIRDFVADSVECPDVEVLEATAQVVDVDVADLAAQTPDSCDYDTISMSDEDDPGDSGTDGTETTTKQEMNADTASAMLTEFSSMVDDGSVSRDATVEDFVRSLIESGGIEEGQVTGLSVFLGGDAGGEGTGDETQEDGSGEDDEDGSDDGGISMSDDDTDSDADDVDKSDADADGGDGDDVSKSTDTDSVDWDAAPDWARALKSDVDDLRSDVEEHPDADKMEPDQLGDRIVKDITGHDDAEVARKALREQVEKSGDGDDISVDYDGVTDDENADSEASGAAHSASANTRMVGGDN
jgi:hypothetical protein